MHRRTFFKLLSMAGGAIALLPGRFFARAEKAVAPVSSGASVTGKVPDYAKHMLHSDMDGLGPDGKPTGQKATYTGASKGFLVTQPRLTELLARSWLRAATCSFQMAWAVGFMTTSMPTSPQ